MEIERKFLIDRYPDLPCLGAFWVKQGYLSHAPEVRIRSKVRLPGEESAVSATESASYTLCIKGDGDLVREELEWKISEAEFAVLQKMLTTRMITKLYRRYQLPEQLIAECSLVDPDSPHSFLYVEVEFESESQAERFVPPEYFGKEITTDKSYKMKHYWNRIKNDDH